MVKTSIQISKELWKELNSRRIESSETFEDVIWRSLLKNPKLKFALIKKSVEV